MRNFVSFINSDDKKLAVVFICIALSKIIWCPFVFVNPVRGLLKTPSDCGVLTKVFSSFFLFVNFLLRKGKLNA
jgi:hypothetical protein